MNDLDLLFLVFNKMDIAVLRRVALDRYTFLGPAPDFYRDLFPAEEDGGPCLSPWRHSSMLEFFIQEAEMFFAKGQEGHILSGVWQEEGLASPDQPLLALAFYAKGEALFIIRHVNDEFFERSKILQKARENMLEHRRVSTSLEFYKKKSCSDAMTALYNKETFLNILRDEITHAQCGLSTFSLIMLDVDNFKEINDTYGHITGDAVLSTLGKLLNDSLRREDVAARYGGEEFIVLIPYTPLAQTGRVAEKLCRRIAGHKAPDQPSITVSIGCTSYLPGEDMQEFLTRVDLALYDAKRAGKNTVRLR